MKNVVNPNSTINLINSELKNPKLLYVYSLEIDHSLMGYFPAIYMATKKPVYCTDLDVLKKVWNMLPPRTSKISMALFLVNDACTEGFPITFTYGTSFLDPEQCVKIPLMTDDELELLLKETKSPFVWELGISGARCDDDTFTRLIEKAIKRAREELVVC